jgi:hypothetical protein
MTLLESPISTHIYCAVHVDQTYAAAVEEPYSDPWGCTVHALPGHVYTTHSWDVPDHAAASKFDLRDLLEQKLLD